MNWEVEYCDEAKKDIKKLDGSQIKKVLKAIEKVIIFHHRHLAQKLFLHTQKSIIVYFLKLQIMLQLNINNICKCEN